MKKPDDDYAAKWEEVARHEPYFALLADHGEAGVESNAVANDAFFKTGEDDIAALLAAIATLFSRDVRLDSVVDFGCGAGRLTLPLARRAGHVLACDVAPTMLSHARQNAERAGLHNITFQSCDDVTASAGPSFDFVCSLLVFQYIPPSIGYALIRSLTKLLRGDGVMALQLRLHGSGNLHRLASLSRGRRRFAQVHRYDERLVARAVETAGASVVARLPVDNRSSGDAVLIVQLENEEQSVHPTSVG
ncbi:MAG TPA: class I SAM-dependent methyltransferase [Thermoanaerobaculia bacterium]|nr:class I SAM-dependent methyltransferase [Thermoanaerobaculia bacterium]